jgi:predicted N-acyltransferase
VSNDGKLVAAVPGFITDYQLDTTLRGLPRKISDAIQRVFPRFLKQRMIALGSPVSEVCHVGFDASLDDRARQKALSAVLDALVDRAKSERAKMIAIKDSESSVDVLWRNAVAPHGLRRQPGLPTACLELPFASVDEYLSTLTYATRKDIRRKLKGGAAIRVEWRTNIDDILDDVMRLYASTRDRAEFDFEELTPAYFRNVMTECASRASCATYWLDNRLVAFNLVLCDGDRMIDKFLGMDYAVAREHNLYFYTWIENVRYCIANGILVYQSGQGLHQQKKRLGSKLFVNWLWYRHRNRFIDRILAAIEGIARLDRGDAELAALGAEQSV